MSKLKPTAHSTTSTHFTNPSKPFFGQHNHHSHTEKVYRNFSTILSLLLGPQESLKTPLEDSFLCKLKKTLQQFFCLITGALTSHLIHETYRNFRAQNFVTSYIHRVSEAVTTRKQHVQTFVYGLVLVQYNFVGSVPINSPNLYYTPVGIGSIVSHAFATSVLRATDTWMGNTNKAMETVLNLVHMAKHLEKGAFLDHSQLC